jgi:hypothetical protein
MRAAVWIISLCVSMIIFLQSLAGEFDGAKEGVAMGAFLAAAYMLGLTFIMGTPLISAVIFAITGASVLSASGSVYLKGLQFWAALSLILALLSVLGQIEKTRRTKTITKANISPRC